MRNQAYFAQALDAKKELFC
jgi:hypothetical protein